MTNDNTSDPIEEKFRVGLLELIGLCMEAGLHPYRIVEITEKEIKTMREDTARVWIKRAGGKGAEDGSCQKNPQSRKG